MDWKRMIIKETTERDLGNIMRLWNDGEVMRFAGYPKGLGITRAKLENWLTSKITPPVRNHYSIYLASGIYCGETFYGLEAGTATAALDIKLLPVARGKGIASRALAFAINQAFAAGRAERVYVDPRRDNAAAWRLYGRLGFRSQPRPAYLLPALSHLEIAGNEWTASGMDKRAAADVNVRLEHQGIVLRDYVASDIENDVRWHTTETEWQLWDAPWEMEESIRDFNPDEFRARMKRTLATHRSREIMRTSFELCTAEGIHIGGVNSYLMNDSYEWISSKTNKIGHRAIGIDICEKSYWSRGYGTQAYDAFINYLFAHGIPAVYTQTWSGNTRMIGLAKKMGFELCACKENSRIIEDRPYDGLTFRLKNPKEEADI